MRIFDAVGQTPLVTIDTAETDARLLVKLETFNAGGSIKTRVARQMIISAENQGSLKPGDTLIEPTGGNTGIGLALAASTRGYRFIAVVPDNYSETRIKLLRIHGASVILSDSAQGNDSHIKLAQQMLSENPNYKHLDQFKNPACIRAHYDGTAREILAECTPDAFVCSVGSAATFTGVGRRLREANPSVLLYVAQPEGCNIYRGTSIPHHIQGTALGIIPPLMDYSLVTGTIEVAWVEVMRELRWLARTEGLYLGASSAANIFCARQIAQQLGAGSTVCTVAPDGGQFYPEAFEPE